MEIVLEQIRDSYSFEKFYKKIEKNILNDYIYGLSGTAKHFVIAALLQKISSPVLIICQSKKEIEILKEDLINLNLNTPIFEFPSLDLFMENSNVDGILNRAKRMEVLSYLIKKERVVVLIIPESLMQYEISPNDFLNSTFTLKIGETLNYNELNYRIANLGYENVGKIDGKGQFSKRGGILDIFPLTSNKPYRIEFFDDEIESIREFDLANQRSIETLNSLLITPVLKPFAKDNKANIIDYFMDNSLVILNEPSHIKFSFMKIIKENPEIKDRVETYTNLEKKLNTKNTLYLSSMQMRIANVLQENTYSILTKEIPAYQRQMQLLVKDLKNYLKDEYKVILCLSTVEKMRYLKDYLEENNLKVSPHLDNLDSSNIFLSLSCIEKGFELIESKIVIITEKDILGKHKKRLHIKGEKENKIKHFRDINIGDYVVHINYGIGKYRGIKTLEIDNIHRDYIFIQFAGEDKLYLPTDKVSLLQKYIGSEEYIPKLSKLNGISWEKTKQKARKAVEDIAKELINLYATRKKIEGFSYQKDTTWQKEFEDAFLYEETKDQLIAIDEIKNDMERPYPMERLLCGDVGFGKTEVAMRAAFKAVMDNKQVAVLVPTTVLAQQHYQTFKNRFENFGPNIGLLCRFTTPKEKKEILAKLKSGEIDILIGTHAILNEKVKFKDLGFLIIDEEQRFGVKQKEKIKTISENIDVLSLSATPIPRTLHMSLSGARDMSLIETPPKERMPVTTYVIENNDKVIKDAIKREIRRGGQVYFIYNRVESMDKMYLKLSSMLPELKIGIIHGKMSEGNLENTMSQFYNGDLDILLATSIVENGLDIKRANTIIIYDSDKFGLSQLYQMRGRVGRGSENAFAYFLYKEDKVLSEIAEKRLNAIKDFTQLGAGFKIAMRDLEIRGAGDILGSSQSGHIASVGFEMYCLLLNEAMEELKFGTIKKKIEEPVIELKVDAYLDNNFISDSTTKVEIYQRLLSIMNLEQLDLFVDELKDRFGKLSTPANKLILVTKIRILARILSISKITDLNQKLTISFFDVENLNMDNLLWLSNYYGNSLKINNNDKEIILKLNPKLQEDILKTTLNILEMLNK